MTKDTKDLVVRSFLNLISDNEIVTLKQLAQHSGVARNTIQANFNNEGVKGILHYIYNKVLIAINMEVMKHDLDQLSLNEFAEILLEEVYVFRKEFKIIFRAKILENEEFIASELAYPWVKKRFEKLVIELELTPFMTAKDLLIYWNNFLTILIRQWLSKEIPLEVHEFKPIFLRFARTPIADLIYHDIQE